jgi:hypothetical protein
MNVNVVYEMRVIGKIHEEKTDNTKTGPYLPDG